MDQAYFFVRDATAPYSSHALFPSFVALGTFHATCWAFTALDAYDGRKGWQSMLKTCALPQILAHLVANSASWLLLPRLLGEAEVYATLPERGPSAGEFARDMLLCYFIGDFLIYLEHRAMHRIQFLRNNVHSTHHVYTSPMFSWAAGYVHPIEIFIAVACEMFYPWLAGIHPFTLWVYVATWVVLLCEEHSGRHVWFSLWNWIPLIGGGAPPHDLHHQPYLTKNFGFVFSVWDRLFGTFKDPAELKAE